MAKMPTLLTKAEKLMGQLLDEANAPPAKTENAEEDAKANAKRPDFVERLKLATAVTTFLAAKAKLAPEEKKLSAGEALFNDIHRGTTERRADPPSLAAVAARLNGEAHEGDEDEL